MANKAYDHYECLVPECNHLQFVSADAKQKHDPKFHSGASFTCWVCGRAFNNRERLVDHARSVESKYCGKICQRGNCKMVFVQDHEWKTHKKVCCKGNNRY